MHTPHITEWLVPHASAPFQGPHTTLFRAHNWAVVSPEHPASGWPASGAPASLWGVSPSTQRPVQVCVPTQTSQRLPCEPQALVKKPDTQAPVASQHPEQFSGPHSASPVGAHEETAMNRAKAQTWNFMSSCVERAVQIFETKAEALQPRVFRLKARHEDGRQQTSEATQHHPVLHFRSGARVRLVTVDRFATEARSLRAHFDSRFADPRKATGDRFVWDWWHVPGQYTALRTPAWEFFPKKTYDAFHQRLVWWGRRTLGCHDVSPPWLSCYVNGCEQRLHGDLPHGPMAFVFSLTRWDLRTFRGGETLLLRDEVLDFWSGFASTRGLEEPEVLDEIPARFNRLVTFDPRIPHGVRRVEGSMDPQEGRLVIHGWFVQPRPFIEGPLPEAALTQAIERITDVVSVRLSKGLPLAGLLSLGFTVTPSGKVAALSTLSDTTRSPREYDGPRRSLLAAVRKALGSHVFPRRRAASRVTLPLVFER